MAPDINKDAPNKNIPVHKDSSDMDGDLGFLVKLHRLQGFLGGSKLSVALETRSAEAKALLIDLFGDPWQDGYRAFAAEHRRLKDLGLACVPALALGLGVPGLPATAAALVAREVLAFRRGEKPKTVQDKLSAMMAKRRPRRNPRA